jgi:hypothetical protein
MNAIKKQPLRPFTLRQAAGHQQQIQAMHNLFVYLCEHNLLFFLMATKSYREIQKKFFPKCSKKTTLLGAQFKKHYARKIRRKKRIGKINALITREHAPRYIDTQKFFVTARSLPTSRGLSAGSRV